MVKKKKKVIISSGQHGVPLLTIGVKDKKEETNSQWGFLHILHCKQKKGGKAQCPSKHVTEQVALSFQKK